jgi:predicted transcriptional regulator
MVTKKKPLTENQTIVMDLLTEGIKRWKDLKSDSNLNAKTLKVDVLSPLMERKFVKKLGKREGYAITGRGMKALQNAKTLGYFRREVETTMMNMISQQPLDQDSLVTIRIHSTGKMFVIYCPSKEIEKKMGDLLGMYIGHRDKPSKEQVEKLDVFKQSCQMFMRSFINSGGSKEYLNTAYDYFGKWLP